MFVNLPQTIVLFFIFCTAVNFTLSADTCKNAGEGRHLLTLFQLTSFSLLRLASP